MDDPKTQLIGGPYRAPKSWRPGRRVLPVEGEPKRIEGLTDAPIPWPYTSCAGGLRSLILCGDLAVAVGRESSAAVAYHWGVSRATVRRWRRALKVGRNNPGTVALSRRLWPTRLGVEGSSKGGLATKGIPKRKGAP